MKNASDFELTLLGSNQIRHKWPILLLPVR
jgi:hypothetical protein